MASDLLLDRIRKCCAQIAMHKHALKFKRVVPEALGQTETQIRVAHAKIKLELGVVALASVHERRCHGGEMESPKRCLVGHLCA